MGTFLARSCDSLLAAMLAGATDPLRETNEPAGITELNGRLAVLSRQLDELLARSAPANAAAVAEASASRGSSSEPVDAAAIALLQQAMQTNDRLRHVALENLANVNTAGFKKRQVTCATTLHPGSGLQLPTAAAVVPVWTTGTLEITERSLDVAIDGEGLFAVVAEDGSTAYTRCGGFQIDADGKLVTASGRRVLPEITVPSDTLDIAIDPEGRVACRTAGCPNVSTQIGQLLLSRFVNMSGLIPAGENTMRCSDASGPPCSGAPGTIGLGVLKQGFIERSNVQVIHELLHLQLAERQRTVLRRVLADYGLYVR
jgi:flagellar basal-body rod protein FlgG